MTPLPRRAAFSMISLLVVLGIIALMLAFLAPFVQRIREASVRTQSINNQKQLGLGCHAFHDVHKRFPFNGSKDSMGTPDSSTSGSWAYQVLPFVEQEALFKNPKLALKVKVPVLLCPGRQRDGFTTEGKQAGPVTDYAINCWINDPANGSLSANDNRSKITGITDGTSNTIMLGTLAIKPADYMSKDSAEGRETFLIGGRAGTGRNGRKHVLDGPNSEPLLFGSPFPSGTAFTFADGSVRMIPFRVDLHLALVPNDGKPLDFDF